MKIAELTPFLAVSPQIAEADLGALAAQGFQAVINNRPDGEAEDQPESAALAAAAGRVGLEYRRVPVVSGKITDEDVASFAQALDEVKGPVLAFCRTGTRSTTLWALAEARHLAPEAILATAAEAGYDLAALKPRLDVRWRSAELATSPGRVVEFAPRETHDVVIVGGGSAGIATASSLLRRRPSLKIAVIEPRERHYYQPGWTLVGGGVFDRAKTERTMASVMPRGVRWIRGAVAAFEPERNRVVLEDGSRIAYRTLVAAPGIELHWAGVEGLQETLGRNGVTSNYLFEMAPYTWELVQTLKDGRALFSQPPMPIKCAGAPQKAMYLACDAWLRRGVLQDVAVEFHTATPVLFGVKEFVPPLMAYVKKYDVALNLTSNLKAVDGPGRKAWFEVKRSDGTSQTVERPFDMIHVCPPQRAPAFVRDSALADAAGWIEVSPETLQHPRYGNVFSLGDACSAPNAKTAAAARKQAPVVALNVLAVLDGHGPRALYDGYGSCPLTVERGKILLAEFGYGGKLLPTFPFIEATKPSRLAWLLKEKMLPTIYWALMLKGREWLAKPAVLPHEPGAHEAQAACDYAEPRQRAAKGT
ncbi:MAG: family phosphatase [Geminicoccaceae bacterium]|jgi:sulfide:quinone oxidoreductase|nr:family phosphatase [Geminicoccaceae bacterium]MCE3246645.1 family phosphatase [Geminicoccaceae bacterium]MDF2780702.1 family phosphatase [Geminicoccaceae bacterium]